jgi:cAMP-dependent protein kinase regulator
MAIKLRDLKRETQALARAGQHAAALAAHEHMLAANPLDYDSRRRIADLLAQLGDREGAIEVYRTVAMHDVRSGHLLPAIVACKVLESLGQRTDEIVAVMSQCYAHGSPALGKFAARQAPVDLDADLEPPAPTAASDLDALLRRARARALDLTVFVQYPEQFLPVPFFSELPPALFPNVLRMLRLIRGDDGDLVIREGEPGRAFYLLASGQVRVFGKAGGKLVERAQLHEGALFGEMALYTDQPRTASIGVLGQADLLEVDRDTVSRLCAEVPALTERIEKFARERVLRNLLSSSPLFKPFDHKQQMDLLSRFEGHEVPSGTVLIREGEPGKGLFVILLGEVEVLKSDPSGGDRPVARLGTGELFGEMALLGEPVTTATVRALVPTTILFLGRDYFRRLVDALPGLRQYFEALAKQRREA